MNHRPVLLGTIVIGIAIVIGALATEVLYRAYLAYSDSQETLPDVSSEPADFQVASEVFLEHDPVAGNRLLPNLRYVRSVFKGGEVRQCRTYVTSARRQHETRQLREGTPDRTILVVGDSMAAYTWDGETWPSLMADILAERTSRHVDVVNMAVGGIGVRQMIEILARALEGPERSRPDLALLVFITDDLDRVRSWKHVAPAGPNRYLIWRTYVPTFAHNDPDARLTMPLVDARADAAWCAKALVNEDPLERDLVDFFTKARRENAARRRAAAMPDRSVYLNPLRSFVLSRIFDGDAYAGVLEQRGGLHKTDELFSEDAGVLAAWRAISAIGVPVYLLHMPIASELAAGRTHVPVAPHHEPQLESLRALATDDMPFAFLAEEMQGLTKAEITGLAISPSDQHPTRNGLDLYARAVADFVERVAP